MRRVLAAVAAATVTVASAVVLALVSTAGPAHALENGLARTPPMGFNNWNATHCRADFNEAMIKGIADLFVSRGLKDVGYQYVNIDDCWAKPQRDANGNLVPDPVRFPNGIKALADYVHSKGLKFGIYTSAGTKTCNTAGFPGSLGYEYQDARLFASWGVDYLKYDNCNNQGVDAIQRYTKMRDALAATGRPIVYSICEWGSSNPKVWTWGPGVGNLWRTTGDISDSWSSMIGIAKRNWVLPQYAAPGGWNDPDMLEVGNGGMTPTEYRTHFSLWAMMSAPLLIGSDLRKVSEDTFTILKNTDIIALDQDPLGRQGVVVRSSGGVTVMSKQLANGDKAVLLLNENTTAATITTSANEIGMGAGSSYTLKDLWSKATRTTSGSISASVPAHGAVVYRVSKAQLTAPPAGTHHLSDLSWSSASNGWGPVERDRSNAEQAAGDGRTLTIQGTTYAKGLGTHALSDVVFYLGGACTSVTVDVGVDDESGDNGTVVFEIWRDSRKVADSGRMTGTMAARRLTADLTGATTLRLGVNNAGDGINYDHADWGNPRLVCGTATTTRYEAENATCQGTVDADHAGFSGTGFCNTTNAVGAYVEWSVTAAQAGTATLTFRYANGTTTSRPMELSVNGAGAGQLGFPGTAAWSSWQTATTTVTLAAGSNRIRLTATTAGGGPNLDYLEWTPITL